MGKVADGYKQFVGTANKNAEAKGIMTDRRRTRKGIVRDIVA